MNRSPLMRTCVDLIRLHAARLAADYARPTGYFSPRAFGVEAPAADYAHAGQFARFALLKPVVQA